MKTYIIQLLLVLKQTGISVLMQLVHLTTKFNAQLNCGRVQTPVVAMIAAREDEIKNFKPQTYYGIEAQTADELKLTWQDAKGNSRSFDKEKIDAIVKKLRQARMQLLRKLRKSQRNHFLQVLYDLTELQRDANKIFGYSAKETLNIMQKLYEQHKVLTYPRTDSRYYLFRYRSNTSRASKSMWSR